MVGLGETAGVLLGVTVIVGVIDGVGVGVVVTVGVTVGVGVGIKYSVTFGANPQFNSCSKIQVVVAVKSLQTSVTVAVYTPGP